MFRVFLLCTNFGSTSFLQVVTIIGIISYLCTNSKQLSEYPKVFMTDPSNWRSSKVFFRKVGFPICSLKFLGVSITSLPVSICLSKSKLLIWTFGIMSFSSVQFFRFFNYFNIFLFEFAYCLKMVLFKTICTSLPKCWALFLFISYSRPQYEYFFIFLNM